MPSQIRELECISFKNNLNKKLRHGWYFAHSDGLQSSPCLEITFFMPLAEILTIRLIIVAKVYILKD